MRIALGQINTTVGDMAGNIEKMVDFARQVSAQGAQLILFPELSVCGYPPRDLVQDTGFAKANRKALLDLAKRLPQGLTAVAGYVGYSKRSAGKPFTNSAAVLQDGKIIYEQAKILLPTYDVFDEQRNFEPGTKPRIFRLAGHRLGLTICEDCWNDKSFWKHQLYSRDPIKEIVRGNPDVLINISSSPYAFGKRAFRLKMLQTIARRHRVPVVFVNSVGGNDSLVFDGSSLGLDARGKVQARAKSFEEDLVFFDTSQQRKDLLPQPVEEIESLFQALVLGTHDYCRKCGFKKVVIGLSGGIDSALTGVIAAHALGPKNVVGVAMPGPFSSEGSLQDARRLAQNLGIHFEVVPITDVYNQFTNALHPIFANLSTDVTEENLQARARGTILMAISNKLKALVLSTGNKSELAVGYCTLYGDMAGGLAVIADIYKTMVYEISRWVNRSREVIPPSCIEKPPSAELRPNQTDQDSLPPYDVLDQILKDFVEDSATPTNIARKRKLPLFLVQEIVSRVSRNEYKRQQAAPNLKVTTKAFGMGRVFPIAQWYRS